MRDTFLRNDEMGRDLLAVDWEATPLGGDLDNWPRSLRAVLQLVLSSRFAMWMAWGPELTFFCNDTYRRETLGSKYPWALGQPAPVVWSEVWAEVESRVDQVLNQGRATWDERLRLFLERSGYREETYHTFSYSPLVDDAGAIAGLLCVVDEETEDVLARRRMDVLRELGDRLQSPKDEAEAVWVASRVLGEGWPDLPFHLLYRDGPDGVATAAGGGFDELPDMEWPAPAAPGEPLVVVDHLASRLPALPRGTWDVPPEQAAVVPVPGYGSLVVGLNPFRRLDDAYADFLGQVGLRVGTAVTAARAADELAAREHEIADQLQSSLLPANAFDLAHLEVATYYRAGERGTFVGGDWYDVFELTAGRTALVVGDVMGRGVRAAAVMGQLRTAIRAYAQLGLPPDALMSSLDDLVRDMFPEQVVTCLYAVYDPDDRELRFVNAGHVPPLVTTRDGSCRRADVEPHPPLGVGSTFHTLHRVDLSPGDGVLLYTDGLVERRDQGLDIGIESLRALVAAADAPVAEIPEWLARTLLPAGPEDDVAVLLARVRDGQA